MKPPTSVTVLAIIGIVLAILKILITLGSIASLFIPSSPDPMLDAVKDDILYKISFAEGLIVGIPLILLLLIASIACLKLKKGSRIAMIIYACGAIFQGLVGGLFGMFYVLPKMIHALPPTSPLAGSTAYLIPLGSCGILLALIYPACVLYFFTRPKVIDAYNGISPNPQSAFPILPPNPTPQDPTSPFP